MSEARSDKLIKLGYLLIGWIIILVLIFRRRSIFDCR